MTYDYKVQAARRALGREIEYPPLPLVASLFGSRTFKEWLHPRDRLGKFIEKFGRVKVFARGGATKADGAGQVERLNRDGTVAVRLSTGPSAGSVVTATPDQLEASDAKAVLPSAVQLSTPESVKPPRQPWSPRRPAFTGAAADLVRGKTYAQVEEALRNVPIVTFDYETTGLDVEGDDRGVEVAAVRTINGRVVDRFHALMNPGRPIHPAATRVTGIGDDDVADAPPHTEVAQQLRDFIGDDIVAGHNVGFDLNALGTSLREAGDPDWEPRGAIDTVAIARDTMKDQRKDPTGVVKDHRLGTLAEFFDIQLAKAHRADADTEATAHLLSAVLAYAAREGKSPGDMDALAAKWHEELADYAVQYDAWKRAMRGVTE